MHGFRKPGLIGTRFTMQEDGRARFSRLTGAGKAELRKFFLSEIEGVPDLELKLERASIHGDHGTIEWTFSGTDKGVYKTGKKFSVRGISVIEVRGGKISRNVDYYDAATIMRQVGVLPNNPADAK